MADLTKKIDQLGELLDKHGLTAISIREGEVEIEVRRDAPFVHSGGSHGPVVSLSPEAVGVAVLSPLTGIFFRRPSPDEPEFVSEGDRVEKGQAVGVIEAMKVFSPVESSASGVVKKFVAEDGKLVHEGEPLLFIGD